MNNHCGGKCDQKPLIIGKKKWFNLSGHLKNGIKLALGHFPETVGAFF